MMKKPAFAVLSVLGLLAVPAWADYYVAGDFNGWNAAGNLMTESPPGTWSTTITGAPGRHEFKVTIGVWDQAWPGDNARADFGDAGTLTIHFYPGAPGDGWNPPENRVGYDDLALHGWEVIGSFDSWVNPVVQLTPMGGGLYEGDYLVPTAGDYWFKFRKTADWDIAIGSDFSNYGHDIQLTTGSDNELIRFDLDLPNGRWMTVVVPEPATLAGLLLGLALLRRR
jgi:hypothetical protein